MNNKQKKETQFFLSAQQAKQVGTMRFQRAVAQLGLPPSAVPLANAIHGFCCLKSNCYASINTLARDIGRSKRTVQRNLKKLQDSGIIDIKERVGKTKIIFIKFFDALREFLGISHPAPPSHAKPKPMPSAKEEKTTFSLSGRKFSKKEIEDYIMNKVNRTAKHPEKLQNYLWNQARAGKLDMSDYQQFQSDREHVFRSDESKKHFEQLKKIIRRDPRGPRELEKIAEHAVLNRKKGPFGGNAQIELSAILSSYGHGGTTC